MHTRRIASFFLGIWIGCSLLLDLLTVQNLRASEWVVHSATPPAAKRLRMLTDEDAGLLLRYQGAEMNRRYNSAWELVQIGLAVLLGFSVFMGTQRRAFPLILCALMFLAVLFQHFAITPEMAYRGREADFPPGNTAFGIQSRVWTMQQMFGGVEALKLLLAGILTSYLFVFRSSRRVRKQFDAVDDPDHSHVDG